MAPLLKIVTVFILITVFLRWRLNPGLALIIGALALGVLFEVGLAGLLHGGVSSLIEPRSLALLATVSLIQVLSSSMERTGITQGLVEATRSKLRGRSWAVVVLPALIGLLPMPGGAYFSAPMVGGFDPKQRAPAPLKSGLNYWFRHIWEYWWPFFPAVLLTCRVADLEMWRFSLSGFPLTAVAIVAGIPLLAKIPKGLNPAETFETKTPSLNPIMALSPVLISIVPGFLFPALFNAMGWAGLLTQASRELGLLLGLGVSIIWTWFGIHRGTEGLGRALVDPRMPRMWLSIGGVLIFKGIMEQSGAAYQTGRALAELGVPLAGVAIMLPFLVGLISGLPIAFVGTCFPVLLSAIVAVGLEGLRLPWILLAFVSGFVGSLLSPTHLCLVLSNSYFRVTYGEVCRLLLVPCAILLLGGIAYCLLLGGVMAH